MKYLKNFKNMKLEELENMKKYEITHGPYSNVLTLWK